MATKTEEFLTGTGTTIGFTTQYINESDIKVRVDGGNPLTFIGTTGTPGTGEYKIAANSTTITFGDNQNGKSLHIYSETDVSSPTVTFTPGSSIKAADLNALEGLVRHGIQESRNEIVKHDIRDGQVTSAKILDGTIVNADINASAAIENTKIADGLLKSGITVNSANIVDGSIVDADINASANIQGSKLLNDSVPLTKLGSGSLPSDIVVTSTNIDNGTIVDEDVNASAAIAGTKINPNFGSQNVVTTGTAGTGNLTVGGTITVSGTVDGRDVAQDGTKLDTIENGATADQTAAEIRTLVEAATDSNVFTDADHTKLNNIEAGATADQTNAEIKTAYEANADTNEFSDAEQSKLAGIETAATADQTAGEIKTLLQSDKLTLSEIDTSSTDSRYFTETELTNGALDGRYYTETEAEAKFLRQDSSETLASGTAWSNSDAFVATTAAINARIIDLIDEVGGFTAIANETSFPATNPQGATGQSAILSIQAASTTLTPSGTTLTIANGAGTGNTVTVTGVPVTIPQNFGFLVESTSTTHTYAFHRLVPIATQINTVAQNITNIVNAGANVADINNFADLYIISASQPSQRNDGTALQEGDLWYDSSNDNLQVYTGSAFSIITPSQSVLDDVAIVSGALTYTEDLGLITDAVSTGNSNGSLEIVADALEDEITFTVTAASGKFIIDGVDKPALTLYKGWTYTFDVSDASNANHPLRFYAGSSQYSTGVTVTGTQGQAGAKVQLVVPESQPTNFQYYCTNHSGMGNTITVKDDPIKTVSDNITNIVAVANDATDIGTVAGKATEIGRLGTADAVADMAILGTTDVVSDLNTLATSAIVSDMDTLADISSNITTVAGIASDVTTVAGNNSNVTAVAGNNSNISAVAGNATNINAVQANATNINAVNANKTNIDAVAGNNSNITAVANNSSNINSAVSNASNINAAVANASNINSVVSNATNINTTAANITDVNTFANRYRIGSSNPTTSLDVGDLFFNTSANELRIYNGTQWQGGVTATGNLSQVSGSVFTGDNRYNDNIKCKFGNDSDLQIFHNTTDSIINASGTGNIKLQDQGNTKLEITSTGVSVTGNVAVSGTVDGVDIAAFKTSFDNLSTDIVNDTTPQLGGALDGQNNNMSNIGTIDGANLQLDFGTL
tara:strand:- start:185 stop:3631 length:3447 start_codon:yes stop_codon:yes gene_type:complete